MKYTTIQLLPKQVPGRGWTVAVQCGKRSEGGRQTIQVAECETYTLAQAQCFCLNNRAAEFAHLLK